MATDNSNGDPVVWIAAATSIVGIVADITIDSSITKAITGAGVIVTAVASYWKSRSAAKSAREAAAAAAASAKEVAEIAAKTSTDNTSKTVLVQTVTAERAKWRVEMRDHTARLVMLLRASARADAIEWRDVDQLRTGIRLRLNPAGRGPATSTPDGHERDRQVHAVLDDLAVAGSQGAPLHDGLADRLEEHMSAMLKGEWEVSKDEAVNGKLKVR